MDVIEEKKESASGGELLERTKRLTPLFAERAARAEEIGQLTDDVIESFHESGLLGLWTPRSLGGSEVTPVEAARIYEQAARGDGSTAWVLFVLSVIGGSAGAYYGDEAIDQMFVGGRMPCVAGHGTRPGNAVPVDGGYELSGSWNFGSGIKHAEWTHNLAIVEGTGEARITSTPISDVELAWDSWSPVGLRATGSIDYQIEKAFVPDAFTHLAGIKSSERGGPLYNLGIIGLICCGHGAWALGIGRRMLDDLSAAVAAKAGRAGSQAESTAFLERFEVAEARQRSARALYFETWESVEETLYGGGQLSMEQESLIRLALSNATWSNHEVALTVYTMGGTAAALPGPIQRGFRDMETGIQHITSGPAVRQNVARSLLGVAPDKQWAFLDLVDKE